MVVQSLYVNKDHFQPPDNYKEHLNLKVPYLSANSLLYFSNKLSLDSNKKILTRLYEEIVACIA